ncbi:MOSC domain-containing protein [Sedimenticola hydrogenitrophicus]|uniref:MOSC domain-containing protein n=1 Tax=Sedimenticola hydrogenitrophicus TaxID=2967975 RepID=UPI0023B0E6DD|nr:MOSC domain-containing protein [Sedimenticola hydrogenitrophicus]
MTESNPLQVLLDTLPQVGRVEWIGIRPARGAPMITLEAVTIDLDHGLEGDRFSGSAGSPRQVTLMQQEHLDVIAACLHREPIPPALLRRNIVVSGINLLALKGKSFHIGEAILEFSGLCHPCSKMERLLGAGGYNAMRGHGGITARVCRAGLVRLDDLVRIQALG